MRPGPIVVAILSHRDPPLLQRLVDRILEGDRTIALIHHDPRGEPHGIEPSDRVLLVADPQPCDWGRMNLAEAMLNCMSEAMRQVPDLGWFLLISGQDYPAQPLTLTEAQLDASDADASLRYFPVTDDPSSDVIAWQAKCRERYLRRRRIPGDRRSIPFPRRHPFRGGLQLFIGDMWVNLARPAVEHILKQDEQLPQIRRYFSTCSVPDEALVPTLLLNNAEHLRILPERRRFIRWVPKQWHPLILTESDATDVMASGDFFARKVDGDASRSLLDVLDEAAHKNP